MKYLVPPSSRRLLHRSAAIGVAALCTVGGAHAQQVEAPRMQTPVISTPPATVHGEPMAPVARRVAPAMAPRVGDVPADVPNWAPVVGAASRHLLEAQASGRVAAPSPPMAGTTASLSWKRYIDSFSHPIPEFFESRVGKKASE